MRNAPLVVLTFAVGFALEAFGWGYIFLTNDEHSRVLGVDIPLALVEAVIISATGLMALIAAFVAAERRADPRPEERKRAGGAQFLAIVLICPPMVKAAESFAYPAQLDAAAAFAVSSEAAALQAIVDDPMADSMTKRDAARELRRATVPTRAQFDLGAWAWASFLYIANMLAASLLWRARPESPAEQHRRVEAEERAHRRRLRIRRQIEKEAEERANSRPDFIRAIFVGLRPRPRLAA